MIDTTVSRCLILAGVLLLSNCANMQVPGHKYPNATAPTAAGGAAAIKVAASVADKKNALGEMHRADAAYKLGNWDEAERAYRNLTNSVPQHPYAWFKLGNTYVKTNRLELAQSAYAQALARDSRHAKALHNLALTNLTLTMRALERGVETLDANEPSVQMSRDLLRELKRLLDAAPTAPSVAPSAPEAVEGEGTLVRTQNAPAPIRKRKSKRSVLVQAKPARAVATIPEAAPEARGTTLTRGLREL